jgi:hypothetical protein
MACLPKVEWLKECHLDIEWAPADVPKLIHVDNGKEFHSLALRRGCERYGISLEYRPPGLPARTNGRTSVAIGGRLVVLRAPDPVNDISW